MKSIQVFPPFRVAILAIPATLLIIFPNFTDPINLPKLLVLLSLSVVASILALALRNITQKSKHAFQLNLASLLYLSIAMVMLAIAIFANENPIRTLLGTSGRNNGIIYYFSCIAVALVLIKSNIGSKELKYLYRTLIWSGIVFAFYCALQFLNSDPIKWSNPYNRVIGTLGNPNFSASALGVFSTLWLYLLLTSASSARSVRIGQLSGFLVTAFLAWSTNSVQGPVVVAVGSALVLYVFFRQRFSSRALPYIFFIGGGASFFVLFASFLGAGPLGSTLEQYTLRLRFWYATFGLKAMWDHPLTGVGIDNYNSAFREYRSVEFVTERGVTLSTNNAHSTPAQIGATFGLATFLLYCALHIWILYNALKIINSRDSSLFQIKGISIIWILVLSQSLLSIEIIGLGFLNWALGAIILRVAYSESQNSNVNNVRPSKGTKERELPAFVGPVAIVTLMIGFIPTVFIANQDKVYKELASIQIQGPQDRDWLIERLNKLNSFVLFDQEKVIRMLDNLYRAELYQEAGEILENLNRVNPNDVYSMDVLASYYSNIGKVDSAIQLRERLRSLDPINYQLELALARAYAEKGDAIRLKESVERIRLIAPASQEFVDASNLLKEVETKIENP